MASIHFWTEAPESFIASTYCGVEAIKLSGHVINLLLRLVILKKKNIFLYQKKIMFLSLRINSI